MGTRRCCCGECYTYYDSLFRAGNDIELLEPDWEVCGSWSAWSLSPALTSVTAGTKIVLKHMVGNPVGILSGKWNIEADDVYLVHVYQGTPLDACSGSPDYTVRFEWTTDNDCLVQIKDGSTIIKSKNFFSPTQEVDWIVCVGSGFIEANIQSASVYIRACVEPSNHWFAIEAGTVGTEWTEIKYSDHRDHDVRCPRCTRPCCFPDSNNAIVGFSVTIHGIENGTSCSCDSSVSFVLELSADDDPCECSHIFIIDPDDELSDHTIDGPHDCNQAVSSVYATITGCSASPPSINWGLTLLPEDGYQGETSWEKIFPFGTSPEDIEAESSSPALPYTIGDGQSCEYANSYVTFTPILSGGCCGEEEEEA